MSEIKYLYRCEGKTYASLSWSYGSESEEYSFRDELEMRDYLVLSETEKGYWIDAGSRRFVLKSGKKRFAHTTKREALEAFVIRKDFHIKHLNQQAAKASSFRYEAKRQLEKITD